MQLLTLLNYEQVLEGTLFIVGRILSCRASFMLLD